MVFSKRKPKPYTVAFRLDDEAFAALTKESDVSDPYNPVSENDVARRIVLEWIQKQRKRQKQRRNKVERRKK